MFASLVQGPLLRLFSVGVLAARPAADDLRRPPPGRRQRCRCCSPWPRRPARPAGRRRAPSPGSCSACCTTSTSAPRSARRRSRWASPASSPATSRRSPCARRGGWRRCSSALGAAVGEACVPIIRAFVGEEHPFEPRYGVVVAVVAIGAMVLSPLLVPVGRWCMRVKQPEWKAPARKRSMSDDRVLQRAPSDRLAPWQLTSAPHASASSPSSPRCCSAPWARGCGSCRRCRPTRCSRSSTPARPRPSAGARAGPHLRRRRSHPRRQPAVLTVAVDWDVIRRDTDRAALFTRLSGWVDVPVAEMEARYDSNLYSRYKPLPIADDVAENVAVAIKERIEDFPGVSIVNELEAGVPLRPAGQPRHRLHGRDHRRGRGRTTRTSATTRRSAARTSAAPASSCPRRRSCTASGARSSTRSTPPTASCARSAASEPVNGMDVQLSIDLDLQQYTERLLQTQLRRAARSRAPRTPR